MTRAAPNPAATTVAVNTWALQAPLAGVQRYLLEIVPRLADIAQPLQPRAPLHGIRGLAWEQCVLPVRARGRLLWSPCTSGPVAVQAQVVTVHDVAPLDHPEWLTAKFAAWYRWMLPRLVRRARHVIAISEFTKQRLMATTGLEERKITVVLHGVNQRFAPQSAAAIAAARAAAGLNPGPYVLSVGTLEPRKNLARLLDAWRLALPSLPPQLTLALAGATGNPRFFRAPGLNGLPGRVQLLGHVADEHLPGLYAGATAFAYISLYEGFGWPPLEAMACGTAVLTSNLTSLPEVVGDAALTVEPTDTHAIANALLRLAGDADLRVRLGEAGRGRVRQFSWDLAARRTAAVLMAASSHPCRP